MPKQSLATIQEEHLAAFAAQDWARYKADLAADAVYVEPATGRRVQGRDQIVEALKSWKQAFPDLKATPTNVLVCGNTVVSEVTWTGTHCGPFAGPFGTIPATGKVGSVAGVVLATYESGKVKEIHSYSDLLTILRQMGVLPAPVATG
jgi:steroid delta-isomerase-like uncharacterized protein